MSVMGSYEAMRRMDPFGPSLGLGVVVAPPGVSVSSGSGFELWDHLIDQLQLPTIGIYTAWGAREGLDWEPVRQPPETNILIAGLNDDTWNAAQSMAFGAPLPWIGILADRTPSTQEVIDALRGTPYEFFHTQAVYAQSDPADPPTIRFLHWARLRDQASADSGTGSLTQAASRVGGQLVFAAQVNYDTSATRTPPATPFEDALNAQFPSAETAPPTGPSEPGPGLPYQPPAPPAAGYGPYLVAMAATAVAFGAVGFFAVRAARRGKGNK